MIFTMINSSQAKKFAHALLMLTLSNSIVSVVAAADLEVTDAARFQLHTSHRFDVNRQHGDWSEQKWPKFVAIYKHADDHLKKYCAEFELQSGGRPMRVFEINNATPYSYTSTVADFEKYRKEKQKAGWFRHLNSPGMFTKKYWATVWLTKTVNVVSPTSGLSNCYKHIDYKFIDQTKRDAFLAAWQYAQVALPENYSHLLEEPATIEWICPVCDKADNVGAICTCRSGQLVDEKVKWSCDNPNCDEVNDAPPREVGDDGKPLVSLPYCDDGQSNHYCTSFYPDQPTKIYGRCGKTLELMRAQWRIQHPESKIGRRRLSELKRLLKVITHEK